MIETHPLGNFIPENIKYLLLGSFAAKGITMEPGYDWYYGSGRNQFWKILELVYNIKLPDKEAKIKLFKKLNMGIADIIYQCERKHGSSLDANLINIIYNPDLEDIIKNHAIKTIFFSSRFVENSYRRIFKDLIKETSQIKLITLPSPSPRYAAMTINQKVKRYKELLPAL